MKRIQVVAATIGIAMVALGGARLFRAKPAVAQSIDVKASCDKRAALSQCSEYTEPALAAGERFLKEPCGIMKGAYGKASCPRDGVIGTCVFGDAEYRHYYASGANAYSAATAAHECETSEGRFLPATTR